MAKQETKNDATAAYDRQKGVLQKAMDDLTARIADHPSSSLAARVGRAHRAGVEEDTIQVVFTTLKEAVADAEAAYEKAKTVKTQKAPQTIQPRVSL